MANHEAFERLEATPNNVRQAQKILLDDFLRVGISQADAMDMSGVNDDDRFKKLIGGMENGSREYYGFNEDGLMAVFASLGDWHYGDIPGYADKTPLMKVGAQVLEKANEAFSIGAGPKTHDGIFVLGVASFVDDGDSYIDDMLQALRVRSSERQKVGLRITADTKDGLLLDVLERRAKPVDPLRKTGRQTVGSTMREYVLYELETR